VHSIIAQRVNLDLKISVTQSLQFQNFRAFVFDFFVFGHSYSYNYEKEFSNIFTYALQMIKLLLSSYGIVIIIVFSQVAM